MELDGMQGSTGAGSAEVIDYVGVPTLPAIIEAIDALEEIGRRQDIEIVLMGGIRDGVDAVKALCLGADAVAFGTSTIIAGGCIACMQCHIGQCVTGIATQDPEHEKRYDPQAESHNIHRFLEGVRWQIAALTHALGYTDFRALSRDDLVFLPANLSRLVIDPYREACKFGWRLGERLDLDIPFFVAGFDAASEELKAPIDRGVVAAGAAYLGATRPGPNAPWLQLCEPGRDAPSHDAAGVVYRVGERGHPIPTDRARAEQLLGLLLASRRDLEDAIVYALERGFDLLVLDGTGALGGEWPELRAAPDLALVRDTVATLRRLKKVRWTRSRSRSSC